MLIPKPIPWNLDINPRPADWGHKVSVCIAIACEDKSRIITVSDKLISFGEFSAEHGTSKHSNLTVNWIVLYAGNDVEHADPIIRAARADLSKLRKKVSRILSPEEVTDVLDNAYGERLNAQIENRILRKHSFDSASFLDNGKQKCTPEIYAKTWDSISREKFSLVFLVCGFDENKKAHIWVIDGENAPSSRDDMGFFAIGNGSAAALSTIAFHISHSQLSEYSSKEKAIYVGLTAKFMAESASDVGKEGTFMTIVSPDPPHFTGVLPTGTKKIKDLWETSGAPRIPATAEQLISSLIWKPDEEKSESVK